MDFLDPLTAGTVSGWLYSSKINGKREPWSHIDIYLRNKGFVGADNLYLRSLLLPLEVIASAGRLDGCVDAFIEMLQDVNSGKPQVLIPFRHGQRRAEYIKNILPYFYDILSVYEQPRATCPIVVVVGRGDRQGLLLETFNGASATLLESEKVENLDGFLEGAREKIILMGIDLPQSRPWWRFW